MSTESGDTPELEALFDSIIGANEPTPEPPPPKAEAPVQAEPAITAVAAAPVSDSTDVYAQVGHLTRKLHDTLRELGYDRSIEKAVGKMPDARDRLNYISTLTEQAAVKTLNATENAKPLQEALETNAKHLSTRWDQMMSGQLNIDEFKQLVGQTREHLQDVPLKTKATNAQLMDIVMAQDYQDLTGQVIKKLAETVQQLENQLLQMLIASASEEKKREMGDSLLNGPVVNAEGRSDIVTSQNQVDELLESLGF
ncbi:chemotaxis protein CheZ [Novimethylophilus kurashikiensis]|uniref:Protein phosphatase CheZ n=1 Tax=Novimethylophilus kurashikiensis TaxID=1825523 RepID=A0A2R5F2R4_9PROT|nr:protein phosphatase CheZ [Novimethylophilus kurashikiensis]GBG12862.1 chemotaxis protein CheZ [Novimethylophilus kurashikiensis]